MLETAFTQEGAGKLFKSQTETSCLYFRVKADNQNKLILANTSTKK